MVHARSVRLAAVVVLGGAVALATTGCGGPMQAGAAAVVQGQRTTDAEVQGRVASIVSLVQHAGLTQGAEVTDSQRSALAKAQINLLVQQAVWQKVADDTGVKVGPDADAKQHASLVAQARGAVGADFHGSDNEAVALADVESQSSSGVAPGTVPVYTHIQALVQAIIDDQAHKLGIDPQAQTSLPALQKAVNPLLAKAAKEIDVKISPRYGAYDADTRQLVAAKTSWIRPTDAQLQAAAAQLQQPQG